MVPLVALNATGVGGMVPEPDTLMLSELNLMSAVTVDCANEMIGLPADLPIWVDSRVVARQRLLFGGGSRSCKVVGPPQLLTEQAIVEVVEGLAFVPEV